MMQAVCACRHRQGFTRRGRCFSCSGHRFPCALPPFAAHLTGAHALDRSGSSRRVRDLFALAAPNPVRSTGPAVAWRCARACASSVVLRGCIRLRVAPGAVWRGVKPWCAKLRNLPESPRPQALRGPRSPISPEIRGRIGGLHLAPRVSRRVQGMKKPRPRFAAGFRFDLKADSVLCEPATVASGLGRLHPILPCRWRGPYSFPANLSPRLRSCAVGAFYVQGRR